MPATPTATTTRKRENFKATGNPHYASALGTLNRRQSTIKKFKYKNLVHCIPVIIYLGSTLHCTYNIGKMCKSNKYDNFYIKKKFSTANLNVGGHFGSANSVAQNI